MKALESTTAFVSGVGVGFQFLWAAVQAAFRKPYRFPEFVSQLEFVGNRSLGIVILTGGFTGLVLAFQGYLGFSMVGAQNLVGPTAALGIARELGPVLTGLIIAARAGGAMAAQLGTMRVTEQIDALSVMGIDPKQYLISPRIFAAVVGTPLLTGIFTFVALIGVYIFCIGLVDLDEGQFWAKMDIWLKPRDFVEGLVKGVFFGLIFSATCTYRGFHAEGGAKGVGEATNQGVVSSMVAVIVSDYFITQIFRWVVTWTS